MSSALGSRRARRNRRTQSEAARRGRVALGIDAIFLLAVAALGVVAWWPVYQDAWLLLVAAVAFAIAAAISVVAVRRRWRWWWVAVTALGAYLVVGVPLAAPSALGDLSRLPNAFVSVATAPVTGWKNLLTLDLPLGTYQATLAPALIVFLVAPLVAFAFAWRGRRTWTLAMPAALTIPVTGLLFGSSAVRGVLRLGPVTVSGATELLTGVGALLAALAWYVWRTASSRAQALRVAQSGSGVTVRRQGRPALGRWLIAAGMTLVAVLVAVLTAPLALAGTPRDVLRTGVDPDLRVRAALSPLTTYREYFSDDEYDKVLFDVSTDGADDRVRVATLSFYDGVVARVMDPSGAVDAQRTSFVRVPAGAPGATTRSTVRIDGYTGIWVPVVGQLNGISFDGANRSALSDGFFYNDASGTGVQLADPGLVSGVSYTQTGTDARAGDLAQLSPSASAGTLIPEDRVPATVTDWIKAQDAPADGSGLTLLIDRLRARGYLSHALDYDPANPPAWAADLGGYSFEPSRAGHSLDRIGALFGSLLQRQQDVGGTDDAALVAAAGDDEQFAVAGALIADELGYDTRIVLGARLSSTDETLPACENGQCRGKDMAAWIEVRDTTGAWVAIDTSPQHRNPIAPEIDQRSDPQNPTKVEPEKAQLVPPPDAAPADGGSSNQQDPSTGPDLGALWAGLRIGGIVLLIALVVLGPFLAVLLAKLLRRRSRRRADDPVARVVGGWDEYVDTAVDHGMPLPRTQTRVELAELYDAERTGGAVAIATWADRSVFAYDAPSDAESEAFWELVEGERRRMASELGWWRRLRTRLSLRSLRRSAGRALVASERQRKRR
ncbi:transglutaminase domain-containing protein [Microbacterium sp. SORGH_AS_0888]|uniref:transglutaminase domain-containing protein n=1 Tax=Microbacterium sp. SORGH_AS_0888 TaxID=3041791 RepID=UPI00278A3B26|nr:transglutaminase domain-containing protein [Microbacterium sp. SORGH_AS_0888]MDQ1129160.1 hypothetical protein [Microbacterium sp. SORGH_AS_0888]